MELLDNLNTIKQRDPFGGLDLAADEWKQLELDQPVQNTPTEKREFANIVVAGMGGSALAANLARDWLDLSIPFEVVRGYDLPAYVGENTLMIASSFSGNTEETLSALQQAVDAGAVVATTAAGGKLRERAQADGLPYVQLPEELHNHQRMGVFANLLSILSILQAFQVIDNKFIDEFRAGAEWLRGETEKWLPTVESAQNSAKQMAWACAGKSPVIYAGPQFRGLAYKWKISFNENAKNVAWWDELPEFNHNEFLGWSSHPVEKPYAVIDLRSNFDHSQVQKRFEISDRLLSGQRPKSMPIELQGDAVIKQMLWGCVFADYVSIYLAILNGVDPTNVDLIEKLKGELVK